MTYGDRRVAHEDAVASRLPAMHPIRAWILAGRLARIEDVRTWLSSREDPEVGPNGEPWPCLVAVRRWERSFSRDYGVSAEHMNGILYLSPRAEELAGLARDAMQRGGFYHPSFEIALLSVGDVLAQAERDQHNVDRAEAAGDTEAATFARKQARAWTLSAEQWLASLWLTPELEPLPEELRIASKPKTQRRPRRSPAQIRDEITTGLREQLRRELAT